RRMGRKSRQGLGRDREASQPAQGLTASIASVPMTTASAEPTASRPAPGSPTAHEPWLAAVAIVPILATVYQTLVLTDVTDDVIRTGIDAEHYSMIWTSITWGVATLYGVFAGIWLQVRIGARDTLRIGLVWFAVGNFLCGAAVDVPALAGAKIV